MNATMNVSPSGLTTAAPTQCIICHSSKLEKTETISIDAIAEAWAREKVHGDESDSSILRRYIEADLGTVCLETWTCVACRMEFSHPLRSWSANHYPSANDDLGYDHSQALEFLAPRAKRTVFDIGCGPGTFLGKVTALGHRAYGLDFSPDDAAVARRLAVKVVVSDLHDFQKAFAGQKFDTVTLFQVLEHATDPHALLRGVDGVVAADGILMIGVPSPKRFSRFARHPGPLTQNDFWDYAPQHPLRWSEEALRAFLKEHGWKIKKISYEPFSLVGAAAYMTALHGMAKGWYRNARIRRGQTLKWLFTFLGKRCVRSLSGPRVFILAGREFLNVLR